MDNSLAGVSQQTIDAILNVIKAGGTPYTPTGIRKEVSTTTGLVAYNLEPASKLLVPAFSPLRNRIPRVSNTKGGTAAEWKVITSLDTSKASIFTAEGVKASKIAITVANKSGAFKTISLGDEVTFKAQWAGRTFEDVKARTIARLLKTGIIREEQGILGGRTSALGTVTAPTTATATTGGTIAAATYNVFVRAVTYMPGSGTTARGKFSTSTAQVTTGSTSTISASTPWVEGASRYEWYVGTAGNERLEATTSINSVLLLALAGTGSLKTAVDTADPTDDGSDPTAFNGLFAQLDGTANISRTLATGTAGTGTQLALNDLDTVLQQMWDTYRTDPDLIAVNSDQSIKVTDLVLAASGAPTLYVQRNEDKAGITGGYRVTHYINKATGKPIPIEVHPYLPAGTIGVFTFEMPFPASDIDNPIEIETLQDWMQLDYPPTRPAWDFEILLDEVVKLFFPGACAVIRNVAPRT